MGEVGEFVSGELGSCELRVPCQADVLRVAIGGIVSILDTV